MRKLTAMLLTVLLLFIMVLPAMALTEEELIIRSHNVHYVNDSISQLESIGKVSSDEIYSVFIDLSASPQGSVTSTVYETNAETATTNIHLVLDQPYSGDNGTKDKLSRFFLYISNNYRDDIVDPLIMGLKGATPPETVAGYVYGERKSEILNTYVSGIVECLGNPRLWDDYGDSDTSVDNSIDNSIPEISIPTIPAKNPDAWAENYLTTTFSLNATTYTVTTKSATAEELTTTKTMDVTPYVKDGRTYVPVRYLAYSLGVSEEDITWVQASQQVTITLKDKVLILTIGNTTMLVNGEPVVMDVAPEVLNERTMLPARWVAEALGATVEWDESLNQAIIIMPQ